MNAKEAQELIRKGETHTVEFKTSLSLLDEIGEEISAFSNTCNGIILVGVEDDKRIAGVQIGKDTLERLANYIKQNTDNPVFPEMPVAEVEGKRVIAIEVSESDEKPVFFKKKAYKRVGKSTHLLSASEIRKLAKESGAKVYWDGRICKEASLEDMDEAKVRWFLRKARKERNFDIDEDTPVREALQRLELLKSGNLTNAAVLLFGKNPQRFFPLAETRCGRFKGTEAVKPFLDMKVFGGSIIDQVEKALAFALEHIQLRVYLVGKPEREERYEYPKDAIREAIVNAICHRDYEVPSNVQVRIFDDRMEVWGCGPLPAPLTPADLTVKHESILRNPSIARCFFLIGLVEQWGTGTNDIVRMCTDWGLPEPLFEVVTGSLVVTLRKSKLTEEYIQKLDLTERQQKAVEYMRTNKKITSKVYASMFGITERTARNDIHDLIAKMVIEKKGTSDKTAHYVLAEI
jgi:ATP-dependent DNA helicase RecG